MILSVYNGSQQPLQGGETSIKQIKFYTTEDGKTPLQDFLDLLPPKHLAKALREIELLEEFGNALKEPHVKHIQGDIWELRIRFSSSISRIFYFTWKQETIVLLHGFIKKMQKMPRGEFEIAEKRRKDYIDRHSGE